MSTIKKVLILTIIVLCFISSFNIAFAETEQPTEAEQIANSDTAETLKEAKEGVSAKIQKLKQKEEHICKMYLLN